MPDVRPHEPRLPCGASYDDLLVQVADRTPVRSPDHQRTCPHCRAALGELEALWAPVHQLADEDVRAPAHLLETIMARVRELPRHTWHAVIPGERGDTRIAARIIAAVARLAAEEMPSVTLALGGGHTAQALTDADIAGTAGDAATDVGVAGTHVAVDVQVAVEMGAHIPQLADRLRAHIAQRVADLTGLTAAEVNITIADITPASTSSTWVR